MSTIHKITSEDPPQWPLEAALEITTLKEPISPNEAAAIIARHAPQMSAKDPAPQAQTPITNDIARSLYTWNRKESVQLSDEFVPADLARKFEQEVNAFRTQLLDMTDQFLSVSQELARWKEAFSLESNQTGEPIGDLQASLHCWRNINRERLKAMHQLTQSQRERDEARVYCESLAKDKERLDWLLENRATITKSGRGVNWGSICIIPYEHRESIDAARLKEVERKAP